MRADVFDVASINPTPEMLWHALRKIKVDLPNQTEGSTMTNPTDTTFSRALAQQASCEQLKAILAGAECADFEFEVGSGTFSTSELTMRIKGGIDLAR